MFKLNPNPTFWVKTRVRTPGGEESEFEVEYRHKGREALKQYLGAINGRDEAEALSEIIAGWRGMDAEFNPANLKTLLDNYPGLAVLMLGDYTVELMKARTGN